MLYLLLGSVLATDLRVDSTGSFVVVSIDGRLVGATPMELTDIPAGRHEVGFWQSATDSQPVFVEYVEMAEADALRLVVDLQLKSVEVEVLAAAQAPAEPAKATEVVEAPTEAVPETVVETVETAPETVPEAPPETVAETAAETPTPAAPARNIGRLALNSAVTAVGVGAAGFAGYEYVQARTSYAAFLAVPSDDVARKIYEEEVQPARTSIGTK